MEKIKIIVILAFIALFFLYYSRPDWGGFGRCEKLFNLDSDIKNKVSQKRIIPWKLFESPKFIFHVKDNETFTEIKNYLRSSDYKVWKNGGIVFGSIRRGEIVGQEITYCIKTQHGNSLLFAFDEKNKEIIAIRH